MAARKKRRGKKKGRGLAKKYQGQHGAKSKDKAKVHAVRTASENVWKLQNALRKDGYFARAVGPNTVVTNVPVKKLPRGLQ